jgi:hypothetical protein
LIHSLPRQAKYTSRIQSYHCQSLKNGNVQTKCLAADKKPHNYILYAYVNTKAP